MYAEFLCYGIICTLFVAATGNVLYTFCSISTCKGAKFVLSMGGGYLIEFVLKFVILFQLWESDYGSKMSLVTFFRLCVNILYYNVLFLNFFSSPQGLTQELSQKESEKREQCLEKWVDFKIFSLSLSLFNSFFIQY